MNFKKYDLVSVFFLGLFLRLAIAPYFTQSGVIEHLVAVDKLFSAGFDPSTWIVSFGSGFYFFYILAELNYLVFSSFGFWQSYIFAILFKVPLILGDILVFYALFSITMHISKDRAKSVLVASVYFLNPYVIYLSAINGSFGQLMVGFILLSLLYLIKGDVRLSAFLFAFAVSFHHIFIFALPAFVFYLVQGHQSKEAARVRSFLFVFSAALLVLYAPFLINLVRLFLISPGLAIQYIVHFVGFSSPIGVPAGLDTTTFKFNFTGVLTMLGLWDWIGGLFGLKLFLFLYFSITFFFVREKRLSDLEGVNNYLILVLSLFLLSVPLVQGHYLMWLLPFILLASLLFSDLPLHIFNSLWVYFLVIEPVIHGNFVYWLDGVGLNFFTTHNRFLYSVPLQLAFSTLIGLNLVLVILKLISGRKNRQAEVTRTEGASALSSNVFFAIFLVFSGVSLLIPALPLFASLLRFPQWILFSLLFSWLLFYEKSKFRLALSFPGLVLFFSLSLSMFAVYLFRLDGILFLLFNLLVWGFFLFDSRPRPGPITSSILLLSLSATIVYLTYFLLTTRNPLIAVSSFVLYLCFIQQEKMAHLIKERGHNGQ